MNLTSISSYPNKFNVYCIKINSFFLLIYLTFIQPTKFSPINDFNLQFFLFQSFSSFYPFPSPTLFHLQPFSTSNPLSPPSSHTQSFILFGDSDDLIKFNQVLAHVETHLRKGCHSNPFLIPRSNCFLIFIQILY